MNRKKISNSLKIKFIIKNLEDLKNRIAKLEIKSKLKELK